MKKLTTLRVRVCLFVWFASFALCLAIRPAFAGELAELSGRITDSQGLVVPGVKVAAINIYTNVSYVSMTNGDGLYRIASVPPGVYRVMVLKAGFAQIVKPGVELHVQDNVAVNFTLQVGSITQSVTVEEGASMINTTDASVSTVVDQTYVKNMPLNGRSFQDLILLTPGVVTNSPQSAQTAGMTGEFSVNGQRTEANYYTVDGVSGNVGANVGFAQAFSASGSVAAATALGTTQALVSVDDLVEFRVQSSTYSAEYGRNPGGQFSFKTKAGTNQWHGTAYDYLRNGFFDAQDWFNDYFQLPEPAIRQNDFGGTFGGPARVPGLYNGKDKTFFFFSYEGLRLVAPQPAAIKYVPDAALRASAPVALQSALNAFPVQSPMGIDDTANGIAQFIGSWSNPSSLDSTSVRFDHVINDKFRLFFRFSDTGSASSFRGTDIASFAPTANSTSTYTMRTYTAGATSILTNRFTNEFRLNYTSNDASDRIALDAFGGGTPVSLAQLSRVGDSSFVQVFLRPGGYRLGIQQSVLAGAQQQWNLVDTASLSVGRHQFKVGVDYRRLKPFAKEPKDNILYFYRSKSAITSNNPFAILYGTAPAYPLYTNFSAFAQDEWRVSQRLSLSVGLRWDVNPSPGVTQGLMPYTIQGSSPDTWVLAPQGTPLWRRTWYNFAPRLGIAYILRNTSGWETVIRGGGGVFFDTGQQLGSQGFQGPGFTSQHIHQFAPFPVDAGSSIPGIVNPPVGPQSLVYGFASHLQLPYTIQWNTSFQQALGKSQVFTVSYVGAHATRLLRNNIFLPVNNPNIGQVIFVDNGLTSDYSSLQTQFQRRLSHGLTALASYTWSHCMDYGSTNLNFGYQRGNCDFDVRHNFSAAFSYDLPNVGSGGFVNAVLHHWGFDDRLSARTAFPVTLGGNQLLQPDGQLYDEGVSLVVGQPVYLYGANCASVLQGLGDLQPGQGCPGGRAINPNAFMDVSSGYGNAPRNFARGFGAWQMDMAVRRDFPIHESLKLQFRAEAFNVFNHPNFGSINGGCGGVPDVPGCMNPQFGQATATLANSLGILNPLYQMGGARSMQFALKVIF